MGHASLALATLLLLAAVGCGAASDKSDKGSIGVTPHDSYSSSVGVLGCKIDTNRVAYWPNSVDCDDICVKVSYEGRSVYLLRIDQSGGAHDISYDAWNYLYTGYSATDKPTAGGAIDMDWEKADASDCDDLINTDNHDLPLSASNSMNYLTSCLEQSGSWVADHYVLYNIADPLCSLGHDETCDLNWPKANQATCPHTLGDMPVLKGAPVYNIRYPTGKKVLATSVSAPSTGASGGDDDESLGWDVRYPGLAIWATTLALHMFLG